MIYEPREIERLLLSPGAHLADCPLNFHGISLWQWKLLCAHRESIRCAGVDRWGIVGVLIGLFLLRSPLPPVILMQMLLHAWVNWRWDSPLARKAIHTPRDDYGLKGVH